MYTIRPFKPTVEEYATVVALHNLCFPEDPDNVENWMHEDVMRDPKYLHQRFVVEDNKQIVACGFCYEYPWSYKPGKYSIEIDMIHPDYVNRRVERMLYNRILKFLATRDPLPSELETYAYEDQPEHLEFWQTCGFREAMREPFATLAVADFDAARCQSVFEKTNRFGIEIATVSELQRRDPAWLTKLYHLEIAIERDIPAPDKLTPQPLHEYRKKFQHPDFSSDAWFIALDGEEYVGISNLQANPVNPTKLYVRITGVLRSHRRMGIATVLKICTIDYAQRVGAEVIETANEENNPMYQLNLMLGFKPAPAEVIFQKQL